MALVCYQSIYHKTAALGENGRLIRLISAHAHNLRIFQATYTAGACSSPVFSSAVRTKWARSARCTDFHAFEESHSQQELTLLSVVHRCRETIMRLTIILDVRCERIVFTKCLKSQTGRFAVPLNAFLVVDRATF